MALERATMGSRIGAEPAAPRVDGSGPGADGEVTTSVYLQIAPDLAPIVVMSPHDDARGVGVTMAMDVRHASLLHVVSATRWSSVS